MTARNKTRNRAFWIVLVIWLALFSTTGAQSQSRDDELRRPRPDLQRGQHQTQLRKSTQSGAFQSEIEDVLNQGDEIRSQILETLGKLVYDHYDELNLEQLETLYRIYRNTLKRKYNIFEAASSLRWQGGHLRASDICKAVNGNVCTCIKNSSQVCSSLELLDKRRSAGGGGAINLVESIDKYFPEGLSLQALLVRLQKGDLRVTPKLLIGLLRNVQYDSFDNAVRRMEEIVIGHLETLQDSELPYELNNYSDAKSVGSLLRILLQENGERFPVREKRAALMLADHVERDVNSISENIENFGTTYEDRKINLKYLFELVIPEDLVDPDIVKARNRLEEEMEKNDVVNKLSIDKYQHINPAQLLLEILRQMKYVSKTISFPKRAIRALRMHADFWRKGYTIDNVSDFLKLFSAYDNLMDNSSYTDFFHLIESIREKLRNSKNVDLELTCTMPRPCLRRVLLKILECNMIDDDTKKTILKFLNLINSRGTPLLIEKSAKNFKDYTLLEVPEDSSESTTDQLIVTTVTPDVDTTTETKTTAAYSTKSSPKHIHKIPTDPLSKSKVSTPSGKKSKPSIKRTPTNEEFPPDEASRSRIPVGNQNKNNPKKQIDPSDKIKKKRKPITESPIKCEDGEECQSEIDSPNKRQKTANLQPKKKDKSKQPIDTKNKPNKHRYTDDPIFQTDCAGEFCSPELDSLTKRPITTNKEAKPKRKPQKPQDSEAPESPRKCEEGQECPQDVVYLTDRPKPKNKHLKNKSKITKPQVTEETVLPVKCEGEKECFSESTGSTDNPTLPPENTNDETTPLPTSKTHRSINNITPKPQEKRPKPNYSKNKNTRDKPKKKTTPVNEHKANKMPYTDTTSPLIEQTTVTQAEDSALSSFEYTTNDKETMTGEILRQILKDSTTNSPTTPEDRLYGDIEENITNVPTDFTEISESSTNEYITTEWARSTKYPTDFLQETTTTPTVDDTYQEPITEKYTTIGARKNKIHKKIVEESTSILPKIKQKYPKQPVDENVTDIPKKVPIRGNKHNHIQSVEETTKSLTSDEECKDSDDCSSEKCKGSSSCSEEGKTSESCSNSSDGSSEECAEKSCGGPDCSKSTPSSSSSSSVECENSSEEKCSTESTDSCADGNCHTATTLVPPTTPLPPPINSHENACSDSDCSTPENCEGESCSNESNCDSGNCDSKSSNKCEGQDCSALTETCEDEDCSSNSKITKTTPHVKHMRSTGVLCDSADCIEKTNIDCQGENCEPTEPTSSLNCESDDCTSQSKQSCTGPNCPSKPSKTCNGDDCSLNCEGDECSNINDNITSPPITESPATFKRTLSPKPPNNENSKPKLCSTKDPNRKRKNERLQKVRQLSNSFPEEQIPSIENNELPLDKVNVRRSQNRKRIEEYIKPQLGPLLKGLSKATEINKLNKNIRNQRRFWPDKSLQKSHKSVNKQLNHSYPYPAGLHTNLKTDSDMNLNARRRSSNSENLGKKLNNFGKIPRRQESFKVRQRNNNLNNSKISKIDHQFNARSNQRKQQTVGKSFDYFEYTSPPQLYQNRQQLFSKSKHIKI